MDENKAILEGIDAIGKKVDEKTLEQKAYTDKVIAENKALTDKAVEDVKKFFDDESKKRADEVKSFTEDLVKKGKTIEEILIAQNEFKAKMGRSGGFGGHKQILTASQMLADAFKEKFDEIKAVRKGQGAVVTTDLTGPMITDLEYKAQGGNMTASADLTGNAVAQYMLTPAVRGRRKVQLRDLIGIVNSATGIWKFYRQNNPVGVGSVGFQTTHGATKEQLEYKLTEVTVTADYLAGFVRFAKQMATDLPFLQTFIANELIEDYKRTESGAFIPLLNGAASAVAVTSATIYAEKIIDNIAVLLGTDWDPNTILTNALNWAILLKTKPNDYSVPGGVTVDDQGNVRIVGIPVLVSNNMPAGATGGAPGFTGATLIGDFTKASIIQTEGLSVNFYEQDSDNVQKNLITAKVEARVGLAILRPDAFVFF